MKKMVLVVAVLLSVITSRTDAVSVTSSSESEKKVVAQKLMSCNYLRNGNFKPNAKVYLCLFSASWCGPCRREMPRIAKIYAETLKSDPDIELIHFSRDQNDAKAKAWAKEHSVKFPVVKPNGGNPLELKTRGIPHLFIVKADGTLLEEGHPMRLLTEEKIRAIKEELNAKDNLSVVSATSEESDSATVQKSTMSESLVLAGPYGMRFDANPGCEKGAEYVREKLLEVYLPHAVKFYGDPFGGKPATRVFTVKVKRNDGSDGRGYTGPSWGSCSDGMTQFTVGLAKGSDKWAMDLTLLASYILTVCRDPDDTGFRIYMNRFVEGSVKDTNPTPRIRDQIRQGLLPQDESAEKEDRRLAIWRKFAPKWIVFEELREKHPTFILDYCNLKNKRFAEGKVSDKLTLKQMAELMSEVTGEDVAGLFEKYDMGDNELSKESKKIDFTSGIFASNILFSVSGPYGICIKADPGCEKAAKHAMEKLKKVYLPRAKTYYGDPFLSKEPSRVYTINICRNESRGVSYRHGTGRWWIGLGQGCEKTECSFDYLASSILTLCEEPNWASFVFYVNRLIEAKSNNASAIRKLRSDIQKGLEAGDGDKNSWLRAHAPMWAVLEELRDKHPTFIREYCALKNKRFAEGKLPQKLSLKQMADLLEEVTGENAAELFEEYGVKGK